MKALFLGDVVATPTTEKGFLEENITELFGDTLTIFANAGRRRLSVYPPRSQI